MALRRTSPRTVSNFCWRRARQGCEGRAAALLAALAAFTSGMACSEPAASSALDAPSPMEPSSAGAPGTPSPDQRGGSASETLGPSRPFDELPRGNGAEALVPAESTEPTLGAGFADAGVDAGGALGTEDTSTCPASGSVRYRLNGDEAWPVDVRAQLVTALDAAVGYYNCYSELEHELTVNYNPGVPTAEANVDGWMSFGSNRAYMVVATAMHEIGHTMGVGYYPWRELTTDGRWRGPAVVELITQLPAAERDSDAFSQRDYITADAQHFWPYGLNQASEHQSDWSLINHVRLVAAMQRDKQAFLNGEL